MLHNPLPRDFVVAKPIGQESYKPEVLTTLEKRGALIGTRKRDGHKLIAEVCEEKRVRLYRSGMQEVDHRLDYIREEIRGLHLEPGTVLVGELVVERGAGRKLAEDLGGVTSVLGGSFATAQQALGRGPLPTLYVFNALHGYELKAKPYLDTLSWLRHRLDDGRYVVPVEEVLGGLSSMKDVSNDEAWEGLVLYDSSYRLTWRLGKTEPRPAGCYKLKPVNEDDFIIFSRERRFNENGSLRDVRLLQWDAAERKLFDCGRYGTFDAATRKVFSARGWDIKVVQMRFVRRYAKSGKLREPAFMRFRDDKDGDACIAPRSWPEAEFLR